MADNLTHIELPPAESLTLDLGKLRVLCFLDVECGVDCICDVEGLKKSFKNWLDHGEPLLLVGFNRVEFYEMDAGNVPRLVSALHDIGNDVEVDAEKIKKSLGGGKRERVSGKDPRDDLPCEWCRKVKPTTVGEIWSKADPDGRLVRLCRDCNSMCAAG